jgi:hypothetical protein
MDERDDELSESERRALGSLQQSPLPPAELEDRVVALLKQRGLLRDRPGTSRRWMQAAAALAATLVLFASGALVGRRLGSPVSPPAGGQRFVLFLYEGSGYQAAAPGAEQERIAEYRSWAQGLRSVGELEAGEKLKDDEQVLDRGGAPITAQGDAAESARGTLGGYFIIVAKDAAQARDIASACPHLRHGGRIVIRPIDPV